MSPAPNSQSAISDSARSRSSAILRQFLGKHAGQTQAAVPTPAPSSTSSQLDVLDKVLAEVEASSKPGEPSSLAQAVPQVIDQMTDTLNTSVGSSAGSIERRQPTMDLAPELAGHAQVVDQEPSPEISPEVEGYLEAVENHVSELPEEIVIADGTIPSASQNKTAKKVVVLPISEEEEKEGKHKSPKWSIKWLITWSQKIIKMFRGEVVYRPAENE
ncbi:MAG: hypothetical protein COY80_00195 [Candidatus Pacebacteria bacterium CG_4_10_14_0_8_um_filter_42_14]|nr:MAG: hypothetical protein COY80_00195 [Candidatus Pacebacteria bacterium CG_4_10_14_0_8_um_filter_42_14]